nr:Dihydrofolate reductase [uncultured bacterium]AIA19296.1 Dihydrofolate reductase [uncultured bacterium]
MIVAIDDKRAIGKDNKLMWHIPRDMKRFKSLSAGHVVIMGRKTYESIGKPLPNRTNIVITRDLNFFAPGVLVTHSFEEALKKSRETEKEEICIIGGGQVYEESLPYADRIYLTIVHDDFEGTVFFPDYSQFSREIEREDHEEDGHRFTFLTLEKP